MTINLSALPFSYSIIPSSSFAESIEPPTSASSQRPFPTPIPTPNFAWSTIPPSFDTCTSATFQWRYSGTSDVIEFILVPQPSSHTNTAFANLKRSTGNTTIATGIQPTALTWTWPQVNASAGEYMLQASGTGVDVSSSSFVIIKGADTSCLAVTSMQSTGNTGVIACGAVGGVVVLIIVLLGYWLWARRRKQQIQQPNNPTEVAHRDASSPYVAPGTPSPAPPISEKNTGETDSLNYITTLDPLSPNRRPPSFLFSDPYTPTPPYTSHTPAGRRRPESITDVSTIRSCTSITLSDATSTAELMRTSSSCPPSYTTRPSRPPSYTTDKTHGATTFSSRFSNASSW